MMKTYSVKHTFFFGVFALATLAACNSKETPPAVGIANPASEHCVQKGGKLESLKTQQEKKVCATFLMARS